MSVERITIVGAGAWGSALANAAARAGRSVSLLTRGAASAQRIVEGNDNPRLPGVKLDARLLVTADRSCLTQAEAVLLAVPAQALRNVVTEMRDALAGKPLIACAKGIERGSRRFMTEVISEAVPSAAPAILSGPSFAGDVGRGLPTAVTLASRDPALAAALAQALSSPTFRVYHTTDMRGVEIGGAAKNVLAIAAGIVVGRKLGASAAAALTTRGFAELLRFGQSFGARPETLTGLSGLGDLILTCSTAQSRNFSFGVALGEGKTRPQSKGTSLAEGAFTASVLVEMAAERGIEMPIATAVAAVIDESMTIDAAIDALLTRPLRGEV